MKKIMTLLPVAILVVALCSCALFHQHAWNEATCTEPRTCSSCGATEGEALGHTWKDATCTEPKTCTVCGETEGEALGHAWKDATCTTPKTCIVCGATEGEALGHSWTEATYTSPKTCTVCGETDGAPLTRITTYFTECSDLKTPDSFAGITFIKKSGDIYYYSLGSDLDKANENFIDYKMALAFFDDYLILPYKNSTDTYAIYKGEEKVSNMKGVIVIGKDKSVSNTDIILALAFLK